MESDPVFSVLTINIWDFPTWLPGIDREYRLSRLRAEIHEMQPDIVCLQEAWKPQNRERLRDALGWEHHSPVGSTRTGAPFVRLDTTGGLFTLSRHAVDENEFVPFPRVPGMTPVERIAGKGAIFSRVHGPSGPFWLVNTHLYAGHSRRGTDVRLRQLDALLDGIDRICGGDHGVLIVGDVNASPTRPFPADENFERTPEYDRLLAAGFTDTFPRFDAGAVTYDPIGNRYAELRHNGPQPQSRCSYVLYRPSEKLDFEARDARVVFNGGRPLSDHYGLLCRVAMKNGSDPA